MARPTKFEILDQIRLFHREKGSVPGKGSFFAFSGIGESDISYHWPRWTDAVREAGLEPQSAPKLIGDDAILNALAQVTIEIGHFPTTKEYRILCRDRPDLPSETTVRRALGPVGQRVAKLREYASQEPELESLLNLTEISPRPNESEQIRIVNGYVYLRKLPGRYKIGFTKSIPRREHAHRTKTWEESELVHVIETDDPQGIEDYWKRRFKEKNKKTVDGREKDITPTEEFYLTEDDVAAFCSRDYQ